MGEKSRKEGGKVFGSGSRATIAILIAVKANPRSGSHIYYRDLGDYLSTEEKLEIISRSNIFSPEWRELQPNSFGDWVGQRSDDFISWPALFSKDDSAIRVFREKSLGLGSSRDSWLYNSSKNSLDKSVNRLIAKYDSAVVELKTGNADTIDELMNRDPSFADKKQIKWSSSLVASAERGDRTAYSEENICTALYRPFFRQNLYFNPILNHRTSNLRKIASSSRLQNVQIVITGPAAMYDFGAIATDLIPDMHALHSGRVFPRFTWELSENTDGGLFATTGSMIANDESSVYGQVGEVIDGYVRMDNVTTEIKKLYRDSLGEDITGDDIFHFVHGKLHDPEYRIKYAADLKKMLPHIETPETREEFDKFVVAGKELMDLHVNYEALVPWPLDIQVKGDPENRETWRVVKPKWARKKDPETGKNANDTTKMIYNKFVTIAGIPEHAEDYQLSSRSALGWIIDRYQVKKDKTSGIVNDPNDWGDEVGNPRYIVDLVGKVTRVAVETVKIIEGM